MNHILNDKESAVCLRAVKTAVSEQQMQNPRGVAPEKRVVNHAGGYL